MPNKSMYQKSIELWHNSSDYVEGKERCRKCYKPVKTGIPTNENYRRCDWLCYHCFIKNAMHKARAYDKLIKAMDSKGIKRVEIFVMPDNEVSGISIWEVEDGWLQEHLTEEMVKKRWLWTYEEMLNSPGKPGSAEICAYRTVLEEKWPNLFDVFDIDFFAPEDYGFTFEDEEVFLKLTGYEERIYFNEI